MPKRESKAIWQGGLQSGRGTMKLGSNTFEESYSFESRFEQGSGTNPEELIAAAHAGCFSMALAHSLEEAGFTPDRIQTSANVSIEKQGEGFAITDIELETQAKIPEISNDEFQQQANDAKVNCPVSQALKGANISLSASLI